MKFHGQPDYDHRQAARLGVLLVNLGTPDAPTTGAVRRYLREFLSDPRMVEVPRPIWWLILNGIILPLRSPRSARAYAKVWTAQGSPLLVQTRLLAEGVQAELSKRWPDRIHVEAAMCYGQPSMSEAMRRLEQAGMRRLLIVPLYPQYSATTTASVFDRVAASLAKTRMLPELRMVGQYYSEAAYIDALAQSVHTHWQEKGRGDHLLLSFHGIPQRYCNNGDPYRCHVLGTVSRLRAALDLTEQQCSLSFQSRVGREPWLMPYTDYRVRELAQAGVQQLDVLCPGFAVDCLETLEEIAVENAEFFHAAGGTALRYIPALNNAVSHVQLMAMLIEKHAQGWPEMDRDHSAKALAVQHALAKDETPPMPTKALPPAK
jgi:ferrochelatase